MKVVFAAVVVMSCLWVRPGIAAPKALVIGNDAYPGHTLQNARNDASSISESLGALGYETSLHLDVNFEAMNEAIDTVANSLKKGDTVVFYYAGHGFQLNGENYLVPTDFVVRDPEQAREHGYPLYSLLRHFTEHGAVTQILILDACRDNPFLETRSVTKGWSAFSASAGTLLAFGTSPGSTANDDPKEDHGLFTKYVLKHLHDTSDIETMFKGVRRDVINASRGTQVPWIESSLIGSICLARPGAEPINAPSGKDAMDGFGASLAPEGDRSLSTERQIISRDTGMSADSEAVLPGSALFIHKAQREMALGRTDDAVNTLKRGLSLFPTCLTILKLLGIALGVASRDVEAEGTLDRALAMEPQDAMVRVYRCIVLTGIDVRSAKEDCSQAITIDPGSGAAHLAMADFLLASGQSIRALAEVTTALDIQPANPLAFALRGKIFRSMGELDNARSDFEQAAILGALE